MAKSSAAKNIPDPHPKDKRFKGSVVRNYFQKKLKRNYKDEPTAGQVAVCQVRVPVVIFLRKLNFVNKFFYATWPNLAIQ